VKSEYFVNLFVPFFLLPNIHLTIALDWKSIAPLCKSHRLLPQMVLYTRYRKLSDTEVHSIRVDGATDLGTKISQSEGVAATLWLRLPESSSLVELFFLFFFRGWQRIFTFLAANKSILKAHIFYLNQPSRGSFSSDQALTGRWRSRAISSRVIPKKRQFKIAWAFWYNAA